MTILNGTSGNDILMGFAGDDTLRSFAGDDTLKGGTGNDLYTFARGDGMDTVYDYDQTAGNSDTVQFLNVTSTEITIGRQEDNLVLSYGADQLTVTNYFFDADYSIELLKFNDGVTWDRAALLAQNFTFTGTAGNDYISSYWSHREGGNLIDGLDGNDTLTGGAMNDRIDGGTGNDTLNGGAGADSMSGGDGSDAYFVDNAADKVIESNATASTGGTDTVYSKLGAYTLTDNVEKGRILASGTANLTGNSLNNTLYAGAGDNVLDGGLGTDTVSYYHATAGVTVGLGATYDTGGSGNDTLLNIEKINGSMYDDDLSGDAGNNTLNGGTGNDLLIGDAGNDLYILTKGDGADTILDHDWTAGNTDTVQFLDVKSTEITTIEQQGTSLVLKYGPADWLTIEDYFGNEHFKIEQFRFSDGVTWDEAAFKAQVFTFTGTTGNDTISSNHNEGGNRLYGLDGNDELFGSAMADRIEGGASDDYILSDAGNDTLYGGAGRDQLLGGTGNDTLNGGAGGDIMLGGDGNDTYYVNSDLDWVSESNAVASTGGIDLVYTSLKGVYALEANVENARITTTGTAALIGNNLNNILYAAAGSNVFDGQLGTDTVSYKYATAGVTVSLDSTDEQDTGGSGIDKLYNIENLNGSNYDDHLTGSAGNNALNAGAGDDILTGGLGADKLTGGRGTDRFDFNALAEIDGRSGIPDTITDFKTSEGDKIDLLHVDANTALAGDQAFTFLGEISAFGGDASGKLRFDATAHILYGSTDADAADEFAIVLTGVSNLTSTDLVL